MTSDLTIRPYRPADEERVWELHEAATTAVDAFADPDGVEGGATTDPERHASVSATLADEGIFLVGTVAGPGDGENGGQTGPDADGRIVAMGAVDPAFSADPEEAELTRMRVDPDHWRQGYGQAVLEALERRARERGWTTLLLETLARQEGARGLYEANGYEPVDRTVVGEFDVRRYRKDLDA